MRLSLITIVLLVSLTGFSQDYTRYYTLVNKAEETFVDDHGGNWAAYYDSAFAEYTRPFVKDCYIAAQLAWYRQDTSRFFHYLDCGFAHGLPLTSVSAAPMLRGITENTVLYPQIRKHYDAQSVNCSPVDQSVTDSIYAFYYASDSIKLIMGTDPLQIGRFNQVENAFRHYLYEAFLAKGRFPGESIIGVATAARYDDFLVRTNRKPLYPSASMAYMDYELCPKYAFNILLHARCSFVKYEAELLRAVRAGWLHPKDLAILHETAKSWGANDKNPWNNCERPQQSVFYNIFPRTPFGVNTFYDSPEDLLTVEANRAAIGLQKYAVDVKKKQLQKATGIWFFFDFTDRVR